MQRKNYLQLLRKLAHAKTPLQEGAAARRKIRNVVQVVTISSMLTVENNGKRKKVLKVMAKDAKKLQVLRKSNWVVQHIRLLKGKVFHILTFPPYLIMSWLAEKDYINFTNCGPSSGNYPEHRPHGNFASCTRKRRKNYL
jgi:hypothetical protein